jgi:hypothetical protein
LPHISLRQDTGYQGYTPVNVTIIQPTKKPRGGELTDAQKEQNKAISKERASVENTVAGLKRLRILKDQIRLKVYALKDQIMYIGCALHNLRITSSVRGYSPLYVRLDVTVANSYDSSLMYKGFISKPTTIYRIFLTYCQWEASGCSSVSVGIVLIGRTRCFTKKPSTD